jgi:hypothetical protein
MVVGAGRGRIRRRFAAGVGAVGLLALGAVPALAGTSPTKVWAGRTSQDARISLTTGTTSARLGSHPEIERLTITWWARCTGYRQRLGPLGTYHVSIPLTSGAWNTYGSYTDVVQGYDHRFTVRDRGRVTATKITGTFSGRVVIERASDHHYLTTCRSGRVRFTLTPVPAKK